MAVGWQAHSSSCYTLMISGTSSEVDFTGLARRTLLHRDQDVDTDREISAAHYTEESVLSRTERYGQ